MIRNDLFFTYDLLRHIYQRLFSRKVVSGPTTMYLYDICSFLLVFGKSVFNDHKFPHGHGLIFYNFLRYLPWLRGIWLRLCNLLDFCTEGRTCATAMGFRGGGLGLLRGASVTKRWISDRNWNQNKQAY